MTDPFPPSVPYQLPAPLPPGEPGAPAPPAPPEVWGGWPTFGFGLVILFITLVVQVVIGAIVLAAYAVAEQVDLVDLDTVLALFRDNLGIIVGISVIANAAIGIGLMYLIVRGRRGLGFRDYLGFRRTTFRAIGLSFLLFAVFFGINALVETFAGGAEDTTTGLDLYDTSRWPVLVWLALCVVGPVYEEMWVRGFMFAGFIRSRLALSGTLVVTSLFWAVQHVQYAWLSIGMIFVFGLALGYIRYKSGSIWPAIIVHAANNAIALALLTVGV